MNDEVKKALQLVEYGYKADHAQLWMHLKILAEYVSNEHTQQTKRIAELEGALNNATFSLDEFSSFPTVAEGIQAMRLRMLDLHAENIRLSAPCPTCGSSLFDCADCMEKQKADLMAKIKALSYCEHGEEFEHITNCQKCVDSVLNAL